MTSTETAVHLYEQIAVQRTAIVSELSALTPAARTWRANSNAWSAVDVMEHLVRAEQVVMGDLATAPDRADAQPTMAEQLRARLVRLILRVGVRVRVPAEAMRPTGTAAFDALQAEWDTRHTALQQLIRQLSQSGLQRRIFRHPIAGPLDMLQALQLLTAHLRTHQRQLGRIRAARIASGVA